MRLGSKDAKERFVVGDPLRGSAALMVLVFHTAYAASLAVGAQAIDAFGFLSQTIWSLTLCVYLFFGLSGFLIARPFVRHLVLGERRPSGRRYLRNRAKRILPAFWVLWTLTLVLEGTRGDGLADVLAVYAFAQVYTETAANELMPQAWTLNIEVVFYLAVPLLALGMGLALRGSPPARAAQLLAGLAVLAAAGWWLRGDGAHEQFPFAWTYAFVPGVALAVVEPFVRDRATRRQARILLGLAAVTAVAYVAVDLTALHARVALGTAFCGAILGGCLVRQWAGAPAWRALDNPAMQWVGKVSYSFYLLQGIVLLTFHPVVERVGGGIWVAFAVATAIGLVASLAGAAVSYRFVEEPFMRGRLPWSRAGDQRREAPRLPVEITGLEHVGAAAPAHGVAVAGGQGEQLP